LTVEVLRRAVPFDCDPLDDVETASAARFSSLAALKPMKMTPSRGEVWLFDLGMTEKVRPALVVSVG